MTALKSINILLALVLLSTLSLNIEANNNGFSVDLIHRDSSISPFYNSLETSSERLKNAFRRSITRVNHFSKPTSTSPDEIQAPIIANSGEYLMKVSVGTPPVEVLGIADTGSDLIWTQCKPCTRCYKQDAPLFDPSDSSTYRDLSCTSESCEVLGKTICSSNETCLYSYAYGDRSFTNGNLAVETFTLGSTTKRSVTIPKVVFGCGHNNDGTFSERGSGLIGLGGGPVSLISQLGSTIKGKFSYCLVPLSSNDKTSRMNFGSQGVVSGEGVISTPLVAKSPDTFYYLTLEAISVGNKKLSYKSFSPSQTTGEGNIIIDSGTTLTLLPSEFYNDLEQEVKAAIDLDPTPDPQGVLSLCYQTQKDIEVPTITAHFTGADLKLNPVNTFVRIQEDLVCFVFIPVDSEGIFGNLSQMDILVGYDLEKKTVSFKHTDCTK